MSVWPHDDPRSRAVFYGDPALGQIDAQLVWVKPPFQMYYDGKPISEKGIKFHRKAAPALLRVFNRIWDECKHDQKLIDKAGVSDFCGAYNPRKIRGRENERDAWSSHAYGAAIDINAKGNSLGNPKGNMPAFVVAAFDSEGFRWGGRYHGRPDWMHFEGVGDGVAVSKPATLMSDLVVDNGADEPEPAAVVPDSTSAEADENSNGGTNEPRASWLKRKWRGLSGWAFGGGATGLLGYLTSPWAIVAVFACLVVVAILIVLFMGPSDVRAWVRKQVS